MLLRRFGFSLSAMLALVLFAGGCQTGTTSQSTPLGAAAEKTLKIKPIVPVKREPLKVVTGKKAEKPVPKQDRENIYKLPDGLYAEMKTTKGTVVFKLFDEKAPLTVANFVGLAEGTKFSNRQGHLFYDGLIFHRVLRKLLVQTGDPTGRGAGGPGYKFPDEIHPDLRHDSPGIVAMANKGAGTNTNGSQFYITLKAAPWLDNRYSIFGKVVKGMDVVNKIERGDRVKTVKIIRIGAKAGKYLATQEYFNKILNSKFGKQVQDRKTKKYQSEKITFDKFYPAAK